MTHPGSQIGEDEGSRLTVQGRQLPLPVVMYRKGIFQRVVSATVTNAIFPWEKYTDVLTGQ